jgi:alpha-D-xyloside xylohydrolase
MAMCLLGGLLASHSRLHGSNQYRVPWEVEPEDDTESSTVLRTATRLKHRLMPYLLRLAAEAHEHGTPVLRAMLLEFPADRTAWSLDRQYMLGPDLLVAPVFDPAGEVEFYVPAGRWVGLVDGRERVGPAWHTETHDIYSFPLLLRPGAAVVLGHEEERADYDVREKGFEVVANGLEKGEVEIRQGMNAQERLVVTVDGAAAELAGTKGSVKAL